MQSWWRFLVLAAAVLATETACEDIEVDTLTNVAVGTDVPLRVLTFPQTVDTCSLVTPAGENIELIPEDKSDDKYELNTPDMLYHCRVTIKNLQESDKGRWELKYSGHNANEEIVSASHFYDITVASPEGNNGADTQQTSTETPAESGTEEINTNMLTTINMPTRIDRNISITLSRKDFTEECYLRTPAGEVLNLESINMEGVQAYPTRTSFVSCRVVIGPMVAELLGTWTLCGRHSDGNLIQERCQPAQIAWADSDPSSDWVMITNPLSQHAVNIGGALTSLVRGGGGLRNCHVITPNGEDIAVPLDADYPGITRVQTSDASDCSIAFGAIDASFLGDWTLYGTYTSGTIGNNLASQPLYLYDTQQTSTETPTESVPEEINTSMLTTISMPARIDINISITLSRKDFTEECYLRTPAGEVLNLESINMEGVQAYPTRTSFVSCRVVIGPMVAGLLGTWTLCGRHPDDNVIQERCQPAQIAWAQSNPSSSWHTTINPLSQHAVNFGGILTPVVRGGGGLKNCHVITPNGEDIAVPLGADYPGLTRVRSSDTTVCSITFGTIDASFLGDWTLYGTYESRTLGFNLASQPLTLYLYDEENPESPPFDVTNLTEETHILRLGESVTFSVRASRGNTMSCEFITNTGARFDQNTANDYPGAQITAGSAMCTLQVGPVTQDMLGSWVLIGKFNLNNVLFTELRLPYNILEEDPANPVEDDRYAVSYLSTNRVESIFGQRHTFTTQGDSRTVVDSCHLRTPDNLQYIIREDTNIDGVEVVSNAARTCGVALTIANEDMIGQWTLIARLNRSNRLTEQRLPIIISVKERVEAIPNATSIAEGSDLYIRLANPTALYETCTITGPTRSEASRDMSFVDTCGFIVHNITYADRGNWEIQYGNKAKYIAPVQVNVNERYKLDQDSLVLTKDEKINKLLGPEDTVYCRVELPDGRPVFDGFGRCQLSIDRIRDEHEGNWRMIIATAGSVFAETHDFSVKVSTPASKAVVTTTVVTEEPTVLLSCQVESEHDVEACKFRDPAGNMLLATQGIGQDKYSFHGSSVSLETNLKSHECGLRITNPTAEELGLWRCAVQTEGDVYFGFLTVVVPWVTEGTKTGSTVITEPTLTTETPSLTSVEGDVTAMSCRISSAIQYCYFRAPNGTIFNSNPGVSEGFEYAGLGLDAGECGIRFPNLLDSDSGRWSCHVGFQDSSLPEQRADIQLKVEALMVASQVHMENQHNTLVIQGQVYGMRSVDYCRFVRIDGVGFKSEHVPDNYEDHSLLTQGHCEIRVDNPTILDMHPWTVVARLQGQDTEIARSTDHTLTLPDETDSSAEGGGHENHAKHSYFAMTWSIVMVVSMALFFVGILLGPRRNREWTFKRTVMLRDSFRRSLTKQPLPNDHFTTNQTATAA